MLSFKPPEYYFADSATPWLQSAHFDSMPNVGHPSTVTQQSRPTLRVQTPSIVLGSSWEVDLIRLRNHCQASELRPGDTPG
jgi:hypothetical protein